MAYVRKKAVNGYVYHYLVEARRAGGKVRQHTLAYLGSNEACSTTEGAITYWTRELERLREQAQYCRASAEAAKQRIPESRLVRYGGAIPHTKRRGLRLRWNPEGQYWGVMDRLGSYERRILQAERRLAVLGAHVGSA